MLRWSRILCNHAGMASDEQPTGDPADLDEWLEYGQMPGEDDERVRWGWLGWVALALGVMTLVGIVALWPTGEKSDDAEALSTLGVPSQFHEAEVVRIEESGCSGAAEILCTTVDFQLKAGPDVGFVLTQEFAQGATVPEFRIGQSVVMSYIPANATIRQMSDEPCSFDDTQTCRTLSLVITDAGAAEIVAYELFPGEDDGSYFVGAGVIADFIEGDGGEFEVFSVAPESPRRQYRFADFQRRSVLLWLTVLFAVVVVWLGRWRGAAALGGLVASVGILLLFILPAILDGRNPVLVAVFGSAGIAFVALYLAHGVTRMTSVAVIGTMCALTLTAVLSAVVVGMSEFTGLVSEESSLLTLFNDVDVRGLLLAGIVLGAAGAIDDVTVTQASAVWELKAANRDLTLGELFRRGLKIGRDHIASMVNTLLLAYAGAALPLMVLFVLSEQSLGTVANSEVVAVEIVRTLVGSIGLIAAVPFTTWLAAITADGGAAQHGH